MPTLTNVECQPLHPTMYLGGESTKGNIGSGVHYANKTIRTPHSFCWMRLAILEQFPLVPSLVGTRVQQGQEVGEAASPTCEGDVSVTGTCLKAYNTPNRRVGPYLTLRFELFDDECPKTCANFRRLCQGNAESLMHQPPRYCYQDIPYSYKGTYFHKIIPNFCVQGGDITMCLNGSYNYHSSAGRGWFDDENKKRRHNEEGLLSMANNGADSNGTHFFITTSSAQEKAFNGRHVCFGRVIEGYDAFKREVAAHGGVSGNPTRFVVVADCGVGEPPQEENEGEEAQHSEEEGTGSIPTPSGHAAVTGEPKPGVLPLEDVTPYFGSGKWRCRRERPCLGYGIPGY